ncbi:golgi associated, gamma adaptin ear containing, ARF binding protein 2 [Rhinolophus ferrumequinum]|uniref:Golgi associated, gamma adaptin ear containing, ARF binding protein 2 n=1 Tax=Rhinolophus ferrumequinum TaxID=59479 RepID=A0A671F6X3_RHIFE|nr:ADP-ribosylation factor-binding protein GGA2 isoform X1 [Rhinolophus ferrumequinum]KAF6272348.1 golgi associated, gamma adaptin ear containing, ARF binding protein 2 [Rhinolophus ferrumequinum]
MAATTATAVAAGAESAEGSAGPAAALELWLNKATDPSVSEQDWSAIQNFCDQVNTDPNGPTHAPWLLAHKIQSPQEKEALYALTVLETCVNHCGGKFHSEVAKFRFLNELIKVLSPKYLGSWTTDRVKGRVIEILFSWTVWFPEDIKIRDAYQMLKKQGIIKQDPKLPVDKILPPPSPWPKSSIFDADEEKSKLLTRLLKSNLPEDLRAANQLIKSLVKEEQERSEKVSRRVSAVEEVRSHVKVLREMLGVYRRPGQAPPDQAALQVVYERCERLRPTLFRLASDTGDDDDALAEILQANDLLTQGVLLYKQVMEGRVNAGSKTPRPAGNMPVSRVFRNPAGCTRNCLVDLEADSGSEQAGAGSPSLLHRDLAALGLSDAPVTNKAAGQSCCKEKRNPTARALPAGGVQSPSAESSLLDVLSSQPPLGSLNYVPQKSIPEEVPPGTKSSPGWSWEAGSMASSSSSQNTPLAQVFVPLESVRPSGLPPVIVYDRNGFRILLHFSQTGAPGHPALHVLLLTLMSTAPQPVWNISFQVAAPKSMRVKLQPASSTKLPAFSPVVPPAVISQVLLIDNPHKEPIRLRYKLTFNQGGQPFSEVGEVKDFPDLAVLGAA